MSAWDVELNVDDEDFDGWRSDVCRVSAKKIDSGGSEIFVRIAVEAVDVLKVMEDGNWRSWCWNEVGLTLLGLFHHCLKTVHLLKLKNLIRIEGWSRPRLRGWIGHGCRWIWCLRC